MEKPDTKFIYRPESTIEKDMITIYGAGIFGESKLVLDKTEAVLLLIELYKFLDIKK